MTFVKKIAKVYPSYAISAFNNAKKINAEGEEIKYTETQCSECPYEHGCCNYMVGITPFEAIPIIEHIKTLDNSEVIFDRIKTRAKQVRKFDSKYKSMREAEMPWKELGKKCVFYDKEKKMCSIYDIRPMNCRTYFSTDDCFQHKGQSLNEEIHIVRERFTYVTSHTLDPSQPFEMCTTITKMLKDPEIKVSEKFEKIIENM